MSPRKATADHPPDPGTLSYEQAIEELESIIARIEQGEIGLEDSLAQYRRGAALLKRCRAIIESAESEIKELGAEDDEAAGP